MRNKSVILAAIAALMSMSFMDMALAQETKTKVIIVEEYIDENGEKQERRIIHEGEDLQEMEESLEEYFPKGLRGLPFMEDDFDSYDMEIYGSRTWLGIGMQDENQGAKILSVSEDSPASIAGLQEGDIILSIDDRDISTAQDVVQYVNGHQPNDIITINILRDGKEKEIEVILGEKDPADVLSDRFKFYRGESQSMNPEELLRNLDIDLEGFNMDGFNWEELDRNGFNFAYPGMIEDDSPKMGAMVQNHPENGVEIVTVSPGSAAQKAGLMKGDVIITVDGSEVSTVDALQKKLSEKEWGQSAAIEYLRDGIKEKTSLAFTKEEERPRDLRKL